MISICPFWFRFPCSLMHKNRIPFWRNEIRSPNPSVFQFNTFTLDPPILWWFKRKYLVNTTKKLGYAKWLWKSWNDGGTEGLNWFSVMLQRVNFQINMLNKAVSTVFCTWSQLCLRKDWMLPPFRVTPYCAIQKFFTSLHQKSAMPSRHN